MNLFSQKVLFIMIPNKTKKGTEVPDCSTGSQAYFQNNCIPIMQHANNKHIAVFVVIPSPNK